LLSFSHSKNLKQEEDQEKEMKRRKKKKKEKKEIYPSATTTHLRVFFA